MENIVLVLGIIVWIYVFILLRRKRSIKYYLDNKIKENDELLKKIEDRLEREEKLLNELKKRAK